MPEKQHNMLKDFRLMSTEMRAFLRKNHPLKDSEQLLIENCLLMLQMEYAQWRQDHLKERVGRDAGEQ